MSAWYCMESAMLLLVKLISLMLATLSLSKLAMSAGSGLDFFWSLAAAFCFLDPSGLLRS